MSSETSAENVLNGDISNNVGKNSDVLLPLEARPNQDYATTATTGAPSDIAQPSSSTPATTSTFKALSAGSYAERIRTSVPHPDNSNIAKISGGIEEEASGSSKSGSGNGAEAKQSNGKRTGKSKSSSNPTHSRSAASRAGPMADMGTPNAGTPSLDSGAVGQKKTETPAQQSEDAEQGWQEVTAKARNQHSNKNDKKDSSSGNGRHKQHGKKALVGASGEDNAVPTHSHEKATKGKAVANRKEKEKSDKESRHQQAQGDEGITSEPTRKQQQQQKDKESTGPKSLGMKSASWRASPLAAASLTVSAEVSEGVPSPTTTSTATKEEAVSQPEQSTTQEAHVTINEQSQASREDFQHIAMTSNQDTAETNTDGQGNAAADVKANPTPAPAVPAVNIWQLRKEKMKSSSTKQPKHSSNDNGNGKSVFSSLTVAAGGEGSNNSRTAASGNKADGAPGKRQASGPTQQEATSLPSLVGNAASKQAMKGGPTVVSNSQSTSTVQGKPARPAAVTTIGAAALKPASASATLTDTMSWPDVAASAVKVMNATGGEGKKKDKEEENSLQAIAVKAKKEKKKWTPIPPAELQEALDKAEKARKAASHAGGEGGKQKRRNSAVTTGDDNGQTTSKSASKKNIQGSNKAGAKSTQGAVASVVGDTVGKKGKGIAPGASRSATVIKPVQTGVGKERGSHLDLASSAKHVGASIDPDAERPVPTTDGVSTVNAETGDSALAMLNQNHSDASKPDVANDSMVQIENAGSPKRKGPTSDRQKGSGPQSNNFGRQTGSTSAMGTEKNTYAQSRDGARAGGSSGRGGRAGGGKGSRNGTVPSSRYSDGGMALSPRGPVKAGLLSSPPVGYQGLPYESSMAAAVHAPGFVPFGSQPPYAYYPPAYYYNSSGLPGPVSVGSDSGGYNHATTQQGGQQQYTPYNMAFMPQQRPVTEIPGLDPLRYHILGQIEYYFSIHNLCMDQFLKEQMDSHGWVDIPMIASFNRIRQLTADELLVKEVASLSHILEVRENKMRLRDNWQVWVFPNARPSIFPEAENSAATRLEELTMHGVRVSDLSEETRERIVGDIQRDILRSKNTQTIAPAINNGASASMSPEDAANKVNAKPSSPESVASDSSSDKVDIILQL
ncbi:hypothetical protein QFC19_003008 [Naganishia cerealis]|uniref:Uncharacterized protein n=1 Tax=Naganishia cerealis TaxID=610337 RepID=A0ACC2W6U7_9TREE|nr:hypothetical protein QFC19_003008 [Naganishia cerealis]